MGPGVGVYPGDSWFGIALPRLDSDADPLGVATRKAVGVIRCSG